MGAGNSKRVRQDWINSFDPRIAGLASPKGTLFRFIPPGSAAAELLLKNDDGFSTNWSSAGGAANSQQFVYYVTPGVAPYPTIQSALNQAFTDGSGTGGQIATILIPPGVYTEDLIFRPGQCLVAQCTQVSVGAVRIFGQHVYTPPVNPDPLYVAVTCQGLSFADTDPGDTITVDGVEGNFFSVLGCSFIKGSATGSSVNIQNPSGISVFTGANTTANNSVDPWLISYANVCVAQGCSHSSFAQSPMLDYRGSGSLNFFNNQVLGTAPYIMSMTGGTCFASFNFVGSFGANPDGFRIGAGATAYATQNTMIINAGTGYVFQGTGTVNATLTAFGISTAIDPGLTYNILPSTPP